MAFLAQDPDGSATLQVTRLLRDHSTDNCPLVLSLVEGGGVNRRIMGYLFGISVFHAQREVADQAMRLLEAYASKETLFQAQKLRGTPQYQYSESDYLAKFNNDEFDLFDYLLAYKMCLWHGVRGVRSAYAEVAHQTLNLSFYAHKSLSSGLATLDFVRFLTLPAHKDFDLERSIQWIQPLPVESIHLENVRLLQFPVELFTLSQLKALTINKGTYRLRKPMIVPSEGTYGSPTLQRLTLDGYPILGEGNLGPFPNLREAHLIRCSLESLDFLSKSTLMRELVVHHNRLSTIPSFIEQMTDLQILDFSHNPLVAIHLNMQTFARLKDIEIKFSGK
jgi:hypothetical protein